MKEDNEAHGLGTRSRFRRCARLGGAGLQELGPRRFEAHLCGSPLFVYHGPLFLGFRVQYIEVYFRKSCSIQRIAAFGMGVVSFVGWSCPTQDNQAGLTCELPLTCWFYMRNSQPQIVLRTD